MADDSILSIQTQVITAPLEAGMQKAATSVKLSTEEMDAAFKAAGISAGETSNVIILSMQRAATGTKEAAVETNTALESVRERLRMTQQGFRLSAFETGSILSGLGAAFGAVMIGEYVNSLKQADLALAHLSEATGLAISQLVEWQSAIRASGANSEQFDKMLPRMAEHMAMAAQGSKTEAEAFRTLGVDTSNWANQLPDLDTVLMQIADHLHETGGGTANLGAAYLLLGRGSAQLVGFLSQGSAAIKQQKNEFSDLGKEMESTAAMAQQLQRVEEEMSAKIKAVTLSTVQGSIQLFRMLEGGLREVADAYVGTGKAMFDALTLRPQAAIAALKEMDDKIVADARKTKDDIDHMFDAAAVKKGGNMLAPPDTSAAEAKYKELLARMAEADNEYTRRQAEQELRALEKEQTDRERAAQERQALDEKSLADARRELNELVRESIAASEAQIKSRENAALAQNKIAEMDVETRYRLGLIGAEQETALLTKLEDDKFNIKKRALEKEKALFEQYHAADPENSKYVDDLRAQNAKIEALENEHQIALARIANAGQVGAQKSPQAKAFETLAAAMNRDMDQMIHGVVTGTERISVAFARMGQNMLISVTESLAKQLLQWAEYWVVVEIESALGLDTIELQQKEKAIKQVLRNAYQAAANAYAEVPFPLNLAAAPAVFAAVMALGGGVASAAGGMVVPGDMFAKVHENEMVLPSHISQGMQELISGGKAGPSGHTIDVHVQAIDAESFANSGVMDQIKSELRKTARNMGLTRK